MPIRVLSFTFIGVLLLGLIIISSLPKFINSDRVLVIGDKKISLTVSDTELTRVQGLSGKDKLKDNEAMLFVFDESQKHGFWMKDMKFSLDIIWLDDHSRIVYIEQNISPDTYPKTFFPSTKSLYVIEANAGFVNENKLEIGNILNISQKTTRK